MMRSLVIVAAMLLMSTLCALANTSARLDSLLTRIPHAEFAWSAAEGVSARAAMMLPVFLGDGLHGWMQLDTGLDVTQISASLADSLGWERAGLWVRVPRLDVGDMAFGPAWVLPGEGAGDRFGVLGLDLLVGSLVLIDYPGRHVARLAYGDAPPWLVAGGNWMPATLRDGKLFLTVSLAGETVDQLLFDTGASAFDIVVDGGPWTRLTGLEVGAAEATRLGVNSWGRRKVLHCAPAKGPLTIGGLRVEAPRLCTFADDPEFFAQWPFPAQGLVGNAPFWDRTLLLDLGLRPRFGLLEAPAATGSR